jgi:hypothetical protein
VRAAAPASGRARFLRAATRSLEGSHIELIKEFPPSGQARDVGKEITALAPLGGSIFFGVDDRGQIVGLPLHSRSDIDHFEQRVRGIARVVDPPVRFNAHWLTSGDAIVLEVEIPPSGEPFHSFDKIPYTRDGSSSRPSTQAEVVRAVREHDLRSRDAPDLPRFSAQIGSLSRSAATFRPSLKVKQVSGIPVDAIHWRFRGPRFAMPWRTAHGPALSRTSMMEQFDLTVPPQRDDRLGENEMGFDIRFPWEGRWRHELHRWPLVRTESVEGIIWDLGDERLPPLRFDGGEAS